MYLRSATGASFLRCQFVDNGEFNGPLISDQDRDLYLHAMQYLRSHARLAVRSMDAPLARPITISEFNIFALIDGSLFARWTRRWRVQLLFRNSISSLSLTARCSLDGRAVGASNYSFGIQNLRSHARLAVRSMDAPLARPITFVT